MEEIKEPPSYVGGEEKKALHHEDRKSLSSESEKDEETSHENEEESLETIEYHSKTHSTVDMDQRSSTDRCLKCEGVPTDGCLKCVGVPTDGCSQLYVGDIEIRFYNVIARKISHEHED